MSVSKELENVPRLLLEARLAPAQGSRFQPTGFPDIGPAEYTDPEGTPMLLVESAQSVANRLEAVCWDESVGDLVAPLRGLPYVRVELPGGRSTSSILEAHRLNSAYIMRSTEGVSAFSELEGLGEDPGNLRRLAKAVFRYDPGSVLHGVFLEKMRGGLRLQRALSGSIEARDVKPVDSGGLKSDRVDPSGKLGGGSAEGYGHVPFHRREYTAKEIRAYFSLDLALLRGYGLDPAAVDLLTALALYKIRRFLSEGLRLRTACDLRASELTCARPPEGKIPDLPSLERSVSDGIRACKDLFVSPPITLVHWSPSSGGRSSRSKESSSEEAEAVGEDDSGA
jgi:CRISPR-associated protein Csb1